MTKLLVVDDDLPGLYMLQSLLTENGYEVETAVNGEDALEKALLSPPDVIVSDILMPVMDGFSLCRHWVQDDQLKHIPFIFYTATYTDERDMELALGLGAVHFITKPAEPHFLLQEIKQVIEQDNLDKSITQTISGAEPVFLQKYNERLIRKLEKKMLELKQANERLNVLYQTSIQFNTIKPLHELIAFSLSAVIETLGPTCANYFVYDEDTQRFHLIEGIGYSQIDILKQQKALRFKLGDPIGLVGLVGQMETPLILNDTKADPRWLPVDSTIHSALFVPLKYKNDLFGVISVLSQKQGAFTEDDAHNMLTLANNISLAISNAQLFEAHQHYAAELEKKVAERTAELEMALEKAQEATRLKSQFISDINHELRTPLSSIKLYLQLLEFGNIENKPRYMVTLNRETLRLQQLIEELLDLSRLDLGKTAVHLVPTDIEQLIGNLIVDRVELAQEKGISLDYHPNSNTAVALADAQLFFQVLTNLLANAINYTPTGGSIWLQTETAVVNQQKWVTVSIIDNGPGITDEDLPHIFERFYRGQAAQQSKVPGTGLGLAICHEIMERHEGQIAVESIPGMGSKFTVWLKAALH